VEAQRHDGRARHRAREEGLARQPGLLPPVRLRARLVDPAAGARGGPPPGRAAAPPGRGKGPPPRRTPPPRRGAGAPPGGRPGGEPHGMVFYLQELSQEFQSYFTRLKDDPVLPQKHHTAEEGWEARWDWDKTRARLAWVLAIRTTYGAGLGLCGITALER